MTAITCGSRSKKSDNETVRKSVKFKYPGGLSKSVGRSKQLSATDRVARWLRDSTGSEETELNWGGQQGHCKDAHVCELEVNEGECKQNGCNVSCFSRKAMHEWRKVTRKEPDEPVMEDRKKKGVMSAATGPKVHLLVLMQVDNNADSDGESVFSSVSRTSQVTCRSG